MNTNDKIWLLSLMREAFQAQSKYQKEILLDLHLVKTENELIAKYEDILTKVSLITSDFTNPAMPVKLKALANDLTIDEFDDSEAEVFRIYIKDLSLLVNEKGDGLMSVIPFAPLFNYLKQSVNGDHEQQSFLKLLTNDFLAGQPELASFFKGEVPVRALIDAIKSETKRAREERAFRPFDKDINGTEDMVFSYQNILKRDAFMKFEAFLYEEGYIDKNYNYLKNNKRELATVLNLLRDKYILNKRSPKRSSKRFKEVDYSRFFSKRYGLDINDQFSRVTNKDKERYKNKYPWLKFFT